jgi:hypothetical protein
MVYIYQRETPNKESCRLFSRGLISSLPTPLGLRCLAVARLGSRLGRASSRGTRGSLPSGLLGAGLGLAAAAAGTAEAVPHQLYAWAREGG